MLGSLRTGALAFASALLVATPVVGWAGPAGALSTGCAAFNGSGYLGFQSLPGLSFDAGDQITLSATSPADVSAVRIGLTDNGPSVDATTFPGSLSYTFPTTGTHDVAFTAVDAGFVAVFASWSWSCVHPPSVPDAPTITSLFAGPSPDPNPTTVGTAFTAPSNDGGSPITGYTATCTSQNGIRISASGGGSPLFVSGLANGTYQCTVTATNAAGTGPASAPVAATPGGHGDCVAPTTLTAPTKLSVVPGTASAVVSWSPATSDPQGCIAGYVVTPSAGGIAQPPMTMSGPGTTTVITGLTNGQAYTFTVAAEDGSVVGPQSAATGPVTVGAPSAATALEVKRVGKGVVRVGFTAPTSNGAPITRYTATCKSYRAPARSVSGTSAPLTVTRLTRGKTYACAVTAANSRGTGTRSAWTGPVKA